MKTKNLLASFALGVGVVLSAMPSAQSAVLYSNYGNSQILNFFPGAGLEGSEFGDEVMLDISGGAPAALLSRFQFNAVAKGYTGNPTINAQVRFYANDGPPLGTTPRPGTQIWDSLVFPITLGIMPPGWVPGDPLGPIPNVGTVTEYNFDFNSADIASLLQGVIVPKDFTWTVQFSNLGGGTAGLPIFGPPNIGNGYTDYWLKTNPTWSLFGGAPGDNTDYSFAGAFEGTPVPEPGSIAMACVVCLGGLVAWRKRSKANVAS